MQDDRLSPPMAKERHALIKGLFDQYIQKYARRDYSLVDDFSDSFSGYTGGGSYLVKNRHDWAQVTLQDFSQVPGMIGIEMTDISLQDLCEEVVLVTAFFHIHLPTTEHILSHETARLVLVFRMEELGWKIVHSGISIPYNLVQDGEVYPLKELTDRNAHLMALVEERTRALETANTELKQLSNTDGLTGIANRRSFDQRIDLEWDRAIRTGGHLALLMIDVDHFKSFNDIYEHLAGDDCLRKLANILQRAVRRTGEMAARYGGEEFAVLLPECNLHRALEAAMRIQQDVSNMSLAHIGSPLGVVTVSIGVASVVPTAESSAHCLVRMADSSLYKAKRSGRNSVQFTQTSYPAI